MTEHLKIIGIEEHVWSPGIRDALAILPREIQGVTYPTGVPERLSDTGSGRIQDLEGLGIDQQILSITTPATQVLERVHAIKLAREANDLMAEVVARNPNRFPAVSRRCR
jgi:predicted TIM-barrel fold metal-dependent hydrolase